MLEIAPTCTPPNFELGFTANRDARGSAAASLPMSLRLYCTGYFLKTQSAK